MGTVAFAANGTWGGNYTPTDAATFSEIEKTYTSTNGVPVHETLSFTSVPATTNPDNGINLTVNNLEVNALHQNLPVTIPSLSKAGTYEWTITENEGNTAGVTYSKDEVHVIALVEYNNDKHKLQLSEVHSYIKEIGGTKAKTFNNTFACGDFSVAKDVTGNMANESDEFNITVTLTSAKPIGNTFSMAGVDVAPTDWTKAEGSSSYTYTSTMKYSKKDGAKTFSNIPAGVTVSVVEVNSEDNMQGYKYVSTNDNKTNDFSIVIADKGNTAVVVTNSKGATIETGISQDSMPYILLLALVGVGAVVFFTKKQKREN